MILGTQIFVMLAIFYAYKKYINFKGEDKEFEKRLCYKILINQYYIPYAYEEFVAKPYKELSTVFWKNVDLKVVDATVDAIANGIYNAGENTREMQNGNLSSMLRWMVVGTVILLSLAVAFGMAVRYADEISAVLSGLGA
jgi:NADH-quinone oxidoreductase subunit L